MEKFNEEDDGWYEQKINISDNEPGCAGLVANDQAVWIYLSVLLVGVLYNFAT